MSTTSPKRSLDFKLQNPGCDEVVFEHSLYAIRWITAENRFGDKNRMIALTCQSGEQSTEFFKRMFELDLPIDFMDRMSIYPVVSYIDDIMKAVKASSDNFIGEFQEGVDRLSSDIQEMISCCTKIAQRQKDEGIIAFHLIPFLYTKDSKIEVATGIPHAGIVIQMPVIEKSMSGLYIFVNYKVIDAIEKQKWVGKHTYIQYYNDVKPISELDVKPLTEEREIEFYNLGAKTALYAKEPCYKYSLRHSTLYVRQEMFHSTVKSVDIQKPYRAIIDCNNISKLNKNFYENYRAFFNFGKTHDVPVKEESQAFIFPIVTGYIPANKAWVIIATGNLEDIKFSENALNDLVLPSQSKNILRALVKHSAGGFSDIIQGKSGGTVLCLEGCPGVGKTLTAEAIAEHLHKPLIVISSGSLGSNAKDIEINLQRELSITEEWGAIALIDEADVFMSKRESNDIEHNAVVSVFLRCLEYYRGVMFVTTNRKGEIDEAFKSRILLTLRYGNLKYSNRVRVWENLLRNANVIANARTLAVYPINGRQIKNAIRISTNIEDAPIRNNVDETARMLKTLRLTYSNEFSIFQKIGILFSALFR